MQKPLRLWPGVAAVSLQWLIILGLFLFFPAQGGAAIIAGVVGGCGAFMVGLPQSRRVV
jgi:hypothetical protein